MRIGGGRATATTSFTALKHVSQLGILAKILQETSKNVIFQKGWGGVILTVEKKVVKIIVVLPKGEQKIIKT